MARKVWITNSVLSWTSAVHSADTFHVSSWNTPYRIWSHAAGLLSGIPSELVRSDAVGNLKRALNVRLKHLEGLYRFSHLPLGLRHKATLERLEMLGVVRPLLLRHLLDIRDAIEHKNHKAPTSRRCNELLDIAWYFLKSTDALVAQRPERVAFEHPNETRLWACFDITWGKKPKFRISGWFAPPEVSTVVFPHSILVQAAAFHGAEQFESSSHHGNTLETDRWVAGNAYLSNEQIRALVKEALLSP